MYIVWQCVVPREDGQRRDDYTINVSMEEYMKFIILIYKLLSMIYLFEHIIHENQVSYMNIIKLYINNIIIIPLYLQYFTDAEFQHIYCPIVLMTRHVTRHA